MYKRDIYLDIDDNLNNYIKSVELDSNSRVWHFHLTVDYEPLDLTGKSVHFRAEKPDKTNVLNDCKIVDAEKGVVEVKLTRQVNAIPGHVKCLLKIIGAEGFVLKTKTFVVDVSKTLSDDAIVSSDEFGALEAALGKVQDIDNRFAQTNAQLSQKANDNEVVKKGYGTLNDFDEETRRVIQGMEQGQINAVLGIGNVQTDNLADSSVSPSKTTFVQMGKNMFNKEAAQRGYWCNYTNGKVETNQYVTARSVSEPIKVSAGSVLGFSHDLYSICEYDSNMTFIRGNNYSASAQVRTYQVSPTTAYIRTTLFTSDLDTYQVETGSPTSYEPYGIDFKNYSKNEVIDNLVAKVETIEPKVSKIEPIVSSIDSLLTTGVDLDINTGTSLGMREAISTFKGWAIPLKKSLINGDVIQKIVFEDVNIESEKNVPLTIELLKDTEPSNADGGTLELIASYDFVGEKSGDITYTGSIDISSCEEIFFVGLRYKRGYSTESRLMLNNATATPEYDSYRLKSYFTTGSGWAYTHGIEYSNVSVKVYTGMGFPVSSHTHKLEDITDLDLDSIGKPDNKVKLSLPEKYELVVGDTFELFYKGIILANNPYNYNFKLTCSKGNAYSKRYIYTPVEGDVGTHNLSISIYDDNEVLLDTKTVKLIVNAKATNPSSVKNVLCVGDSLMQNGTMVSECCRRLTGSGGSPIADNLTNIKFIGSVNGTNGAKFTAYGGWTYNHYNTAGIKQDQATWITVSSGMKDNNHQHTVWKDSNNNTWKLETLDTENNRIKLIRNVYGTYDLPQSGTLTWVSGGADKTNIVYAFYKYEDTNPFWIDGEVNFKKYAQSLGASSIDHCYVLLGWNQTGNTEDKFKEGARTFINNLRRSYPNCRITLLGLQVPSIDGFGHNYGCSWNYYDKLKVVFNMNQWNYDLTKEFDKVDFINIAGQFDSENNILTDTRSVNVRNSKTEVFGSNGVHPAGSGSMQIGDAIYRHLTHYINA